MAASKPSAEQLITDNIDVWTSAIKKRGSQGRGSNKKIELYGIKKLRELILELAVRGLLVPQDPNEEPASVLLEKIAAEKEQLVKDKKIKKQKILPPISEDEKPFELPDGWLWSRLGVVCKKVTDGSHNPPRDSGEGYPMLSSQNVNYDVIDFDSPSRFVTQEDFERENLRTAIKPLDVLLNIVASIGRSAVVPIDAPEFVLQRSVAVLSSKVNSYYLAKMLVSPLCLNYYNTHAKGTAQKGIYLGKLSMMPLAIPPESEQPRIHAKVNELMALCDQLEQQTETSLTAHQTLVETLLNTLLTAAQTTPTNTNKATSSTQESSFDQSWNRIAQHFDVLFTTEHSIDQLKQTILQLAVMGKLVPQDPNDEPASVLLEKIAAEKEQLIKDKKIKKQKALPEISEDEKPFELPSGWEWCYLSSLATFENGDRSSKYPNKGDLVDNGIPFFGAPDIKAGKLAYSNDLRFISEEKFGELSNGKLIDRDFVMLLRGTVGKVAQFHSNENHNTGFINAQMLIIRLFDSEVDSYLAKFFISSVFKSDIGGKISGAVIRQIPASVIAGIKLPLPPKQERTRIGKKVDELMTLCDTLKLLISETQLTQLHLADAMAEQALN